MFEFMRFLETKLSSVLRDILKDSFEIHHKTLSSPKGSSLNFASNINPFVPNAPFLYPLKALEKCFKWAENRCIGSKWVKPI